MQLEDYLDIQSNDDIRIRGHRIGLEQIVDLYQQGYTPEQIMLEFPGLELEKIYGVITYYLHNQAEVDAYVARVFAWQDEQYAAAQRTPDPLLQRIRSQVGVHPQ